MGSKEKDHDGNVVTQQEESTALFKGKASKEKKGTLKTRNWVGEKVGGQNSEVVRV